MKHTFISISLILTVIIASAGVKDPIFDHSTWHKLVQKYVSEEGNVDYEGFKKDREFLKQYISELNVQTPEPNWSKNAIKAYWINAYNAFTVDLILENYPLKSIQEINGGKAWDLQFIELGGKKYSLNNIEHDILRKKYKDPRIHFAVNCASISCPKLNNAAFSEVDLERQLETLTRAFLKDKSKNLIERDKVEISKLFDWYEDDFKIYGTVIDFLDAYYNEEISKSAKISYKSYNWNLNK